MAVNTSMFVKIGANISDFSSKMKNVQRSLTNTSKQMKNIGKSMSMSVTAPLAGFAALSVKAFSEQAEAEQKLLTALKGNEKAFASLTAQAKELQKVTLFGDEETMKAQALIAAMVKEEEQILRVMPLVQDFATAKGMDLAGAADLVSKTLGSSTNALSRYGIEVTGAVGSQERLESLTKGLTVAFEGQAEAVAKVGSGPLIQLKNQFGDLMEEIGGLVMGALVPLLEWLKTALTWFQSLSKETKTTAVVIAGLTAAIGPLVYIGGVLVGVFASMVSPIGLVVLGITALGLAIASIIDNWKALKERFSDIGWWKNMLIEMVAFFVENNPFSHIIEGWNFVAEKFGKEGIKNPFEMAADKLRDLKVETKDYENDLISLGDTFSGLGEKMKGVLGGSISAAPTTTGGGTTGGGVNVQRGFQASALLPPTETLALTTEQIKLQEEAVLSLSNTYSEFGESMKGVLGQLGANLQQGADSFKEYGMKVREEVTGVIRALISQGVAQAITNSLSSLEAKISPFMIPVLAGLASGLATTAFNSMIPAFAKGGIVTGPTMGLIGEAGPEVIFPLDKLKSFMGEGMGGKVQVQGILTGQDIFLSNARTDISLNRIAG
tara:strand:- start:627 stop:2450 length:1824 start_codon:yes stop_codon:yes gene_type:complete